MNKSLGSHDNIMVATISSSKTANRMGPVRRYHITADGFVGYKAAHIFFQTLIDSSTPLLFSTSPSTSVIYLSRLFSCSLFIMPLFFLP